MSISKEIINTSSFFEMTPNLGGIRFEKMEDETRNYKYSISIVRPDLKPEYTMYLDRYQMIRIKEILNVLMEY